MPDGFCFFDGDVPACAAAKWSPSRLMSRRRANTQLLLRSIIEPIYVLFIILASANLVVLAAPREKRQRSGDAINAYNKRGAGHRPAPRYCLHGLAGQRYYETAEPC